MQKHYRLVYCLKADTPSRWSAINQCPALIEHWLAQFLLCVPDRWHFSDPVWVFWPIEHVESGSVCVATISERENSDCISRFVYLQS